MCAKRGPDADSDISAMRDCVFDLYKDGVPGGYDAKREARDLLVLELVRLGVPRARIVALMHSWNLRCEIPWTQAERRRFIDDFVLKWLAQKPEVYQLSCHGSRLRPLCFRDRRFCFFWHSRRQAGNAARAGGVAELSRFSTVWEPWLRANHVNARNICTVWRVLVQWVVHHDLAYSDTLYIGYRKIAELAAEWFAAPLSYSSKNTDDAMPAYRAIRALETYGLVQRAQQGEPKRRANRFQRKSNGYRLVFPLPDPPENTVWQR